MTIFVSVLFYVAIPLGLAVLTRRAMIRKKELTGLKTG
ncbi:Arsenical-resistance protein ACR3 [Methanosarcina lacustris Z-7289]|uniref:Arsenical-resistance protein ACR3 n=1 Tax=Methanosarcina lacustris Z-7289 TaxID=1434111 RepID=A0A0E3S4R1_9EURY|nr:Arsenical-resistance protein ACR3 [Methanosarcina lacustris Z-7289]